MHTLHVFLDRSHLQLLIAIKENEQIGAAARSLNLSPSAASHRVKEAERRLGLKLVVLQGRVAKLTPAGSHLATVAKSTEQETGRAEETARWLALNKTASVRLAVGFYDAMPWLLHVLKRDDLGVQIDVVRVATGDEQRALRSGEADVAFVPIIDEPSNLGICDIVADQLVAVVPPGVSPQRASGELQASDLRLLTYLAAGFEPVAGWELDRFFLPSRSTPHALRQVGSLSLMLAMFGPRDASSPKASHFASIQPRLAIPRSQTDAYLIQDLAMNIDVTWVGLTRQNRSSAERNDSKMIDLVIDAACSAIRSSTERS